MHNEVIRIIRAFVEDWRENELIIVNIFLCVSLRICNMLCIVDLF